MPANVEIQSDAGTPLTSWNFGAVSGGNFTQQKFILENTGNAAATQTAVSVTRLVQNDGIDFISVAPDVGGNPGAYQTGALLVGTLAPAQEAAFWVKVVVPAGTTPQGNPRQFSINADYLGT